MTTLGSAPQDGATPQAPAFDSDFFSTTTVNPEPAVTTPPQVEQQVTAPAPTPEVKAAEAPKASDFDFDSAFQARMGMGVDEFKNYFSYVVEERNRVIEENFKRDLSARLGLDGEELTERYNKINEVFNALPKEKQDRLLSSPGGNLQAALIINDHLRREAEHAAKASVPAMDGNSTSGAKPKREYRKSEYRRLRPGSDPELEAAFDKAWRDGTIIIDC